jgi:hypothetical protein
VPALRQCGDCYAFREVQRTANPSMAEPMLCLPVHMVGSLTVPRRSAHADEDPSGAGQLVGWLVLSVVTPSASPKAPHGGSLRSELVGRHQAPITPRCPLPAATAASRAW